MSGQNTQAASARWFTGILALIALPLFAIGLWSFKMLLWDYLWTAHQARQWPQVQASVVDVEWKWQPGRQMSSGRLWRDMQIVVNYRYQFATGSYAGTKVGIDSFAARDEKLYRRLRNAMKHHASVTAWVNPERPEQAALDVEVRMLAVGVYALVGSLFTAIGGGILFLLGRANPQ